MALIKPHISNLHHQDNKGRIVQSPIAGFPDVDLLEDAEQIGASWEDIGDEQYVASCSGTIMLAITPEDSTVFEFRMLFRKTSAGSNYPESMYAGDQETLEPRVHTLDATQLAATGTGYLVFNNPGFDYAVLQAKFTTGGGTAGSVTAATMRLI